MYYWIIFHIILANDLSGNELIKTFTRVISSYDVANVYVGACRLVDTALDLRSKDSEFNSHC